MDSKAPTIGLVLSGGGARGAYEMGALSVLLPWLQKEYGQRPEIIVGTSIGAISSAYLGAHADEEMEALVEGGCKAWSEIKFRDVVSPLFSPGEVATISRLGLSLLFQRAVPYSLFDSSPLAKTIHRVAKPEDIHGNIENGHLRACAVVTTAGHTNRSVVFHDGASNPPSDPRRGIDYVPTPIKTEHVHASAAIPVVFRAVRVSEPPDRTGWYFDGGTRLNTPIKPALELGADHVIVIGLNSARLPKAQPSFEEQPDLFDGASQVAQGLLGDQVINDLETLATINEAVLTKDKDAGGSSLRLIPYIFVAPETQNAIGEIAREVYRKHYSQGRGLLRSRDLAFLGRLLDADRNPTRGELFSYFFFEPAFAEELIELGRENARRWTEESHDDGAWQQGPLGRTQAAAARRR